MTPKKLHRFLIDTIPNETTWRITDEHIVHQLFSVLKISIGEPFILFISGGNDIVVEIKQRDKNSLVVEKKEERENVALPRTIIAAVSITKGASFELIVQKLTEIGVHTIIPLLSNRTVKQAVRMDRLQKISNEALEQSSGNIKVILEEPISLSDCLEKYKDYYKILCDAHTGKEVGTIPNEVVLFIGPEGGWDEKDASEFSTHNIETLSLGSKILRTETAAIVATHKILWQH